MFSYSQNSWRSYSMISTKFLDKISHFHSLLKRVIPYNNKPVVEENHDDLALWIQSPHSPSSADHVPNLDPPSNPSSTDLADKITNVDQDVQNQEPPISDKVQNQKPIGEEGQDEELASEELLYMNTVCEELENLVLEEEGKVREKVSENGGTSFLGEDHEVGSEGGGLQENDYAKDEEVTHDYNGERSEVQVMNGNYGRYQHPVRPGVRTGMCKFGPTCKFNHPPKKWNQGARDKVVKERQDYSVRLGQNECKYFMSGGCKFGKACKFKHGTEKTPVSQIVDFNFLGLPIRPGERECPFYMRNGSCKYGSKCRFHHPDPSAAGVSDSGYANGGGSGSYQNASHSSWTPRPSNDNNHYGPMMFPPTREVPPQPEWNAYKERWRALNNNNNTLTKPCIDDSQPSLVEENHDDLGLGFQSPHSPSSADHVPNLDPPSNPSSTDLADKITNVDQDVQNQEPPISDEVQNQKPIGEEGQDDESASEELLYMNTVCEELENLVLEEEGKVREKVAENGGTSFLGEDHEVRSEGGGFEENDYAKDEGVTHGERSESEVQVMNGNYGRYQHPVRPGAEECTFYMRTGMCKFGPTCKFNHPPKKWNQGARDKVVKERQDYSVRLGQNECKYFMSGGCKIGKACKFKHGTEKTPVSQIVDFNFLGLPIRPGERECPFYMRNGSCKYGSNCRFHHPDPSAAGVSDSGYANGGGSGSYQNASHSSRTPRPSNDNNHYGPMMFPPTREVP